MRASYQPLRASARLLESPFLWGFLGVLLLALELLLPMCSGACAEPQPYKTMVPKNYLGGPIAPMLILFYECIPGYGPIDPSKPIRTVCQYDGSYKPALKESCTKLIGLFESQRFFVSHLYVYQMETSPIETRIYLDIMKQLFIVVSLRMQQIIIHLSERAYLFVLGLTNGVVSLLIVKTNMQIDRTFAMPAIGQEARGAGAGAGLGVVGVADWASGTLSSRSQRPRKLSVCAMAVLQHRRGLWGSELTSYHGPSKAGELGACPLRYQAFQKPSPRQRLLKGLVHQRTDTQLPCD
ncbi:hypothetical protein QTO34_011535 [Cnephaeus nilssonii]|uniref:Sushi domain-containing protein n=1 Tax=Cnephaeus nilssonii TaxID=3371016 RepID=A0AA40HDP2_CNENI|nr:hypothetical protein QTO34_011535 [Eptesicus nilssonii]